MTSSIPKTNSHGLVTNADSRVTPAQRELAERSERNNAFVEQRVKETGTIGSSTRPKVIDKSTDLMPTFDQIADTGDGHEGRPVTPVAIEVNGHGGFDYILTPYDYEMVKQGKVCARCLEWQAETWTENCMWRGKNHGCGYKRNIEFDLNYIKPKILTGEK